jgi:hypothetical protein
MVESRKPSNNQSKFIVLWEKMDRTAYNDILEANLNNNLQEQLCAWWKNVGKSLTCLLMSNPNYVINVFST